MMNGSMTVGTAGMNGMKTLEPTRDINECLHLAIDNVERERPTRLANYQQASGSATHRPSTSWADRKAHLDNPVPPATARPGAGHRYLDAPRGGRPWTAFEAVASDAPSPRLQVDMPPPLNVDLHHYKRRTKQAADFDPEAEMSHPTWATLLGNEAKADLLGALDKTRPAGAGGDRQEPFWTRLEEERVKAQHAALSPRGEKAAHFLVQYRHLETEVRAAQEARRKIALNVRKPTRPQFDCVPVLNNYKPFKKHPAYYEHLAAQHRGCFNLQRNFEVRVV